MLVPVGCGEPIGQDRWDHFNGAERRLPNLGYHIGSIYPVISLFGDIWAGPLSANETDRREMGCAVVRMWRKGVSGEDQFSRK